MMKLPHWIKKRRLQQRLQGQGEAGFTLLELLIALVIGSIILAGLMTLVVEMLKLERRETTVDDVQRDMKRALNYMASDVSEAIFVYVPQKADGTLTTWDDAASDANTFEAIKALAQNHDQVDVDNIVLAFWRPDFIEDPGDFPPASLCGAATQRTNLSQTQEDCRNLRERRGYFTLVVYQVVPNGERNDNGVWEGQARLERYALPMYEDTKTLDRSEGFDHNDGPIDTDPTDNQEITFFNWTPNGTTIDGQSTVLVDFVANDLPNIDFSDPNTVTCSQGLDAITPKNGVEGFYTCIRTPGEYDTDEELLLLENQNLEIHLQGDIAPLAGLNQALGTDAVSQGSKLPALTTGVFIQGLIGYDPTR
jgi:prepilin-type N-terminal cleavage/methylation domain-containing protein